MMQNVPLVLFDPLQDEHFNDCACADLPQVFNFETNVGVNDCVCADYAAAGQPVPGLTAQMAPDLYLETLTPDFSLVFNPLSATGPVVLNPPALTRLQQFKTPQPLVGPVDERLAQAGLLTPTGASGLPQWERAQTLTAWLHVTNACNLDCPYCYVRKSNASMPVATGLKAVAALFDTAQKHHFKTVKIKYAGGEAALHFERIRQFHQAARQLAGQKNIGLAAVVLSNGTVWTADMAAWLRENQVKVMISLDGVGPDHDVQRPTRGGQGSFAKIAQVIDHLLLPQGIRPDISITITARNAAGAAGAVAWAIDRDLPFNLNFYRETAQSAVHQDLRLEEDQIIAGMHQVYAVVRQKLPVRPFLSGLLDRVQPAAHQHTCGVGQNYLVFSHTGQVAQCQMSLAHSPFWDSAGDPLALVKTGPIPVININDKTDCSQCRWRYQCTGGCPLETYRLTGRYDRRSPNCHIYTTLFPEALRLEGLRLLKQNGCWQ